MSVTAAGVGVSQLDRILAPVPERSLVLVANDPGVEADAFLYHAAHQRLAEGRHVVYVAYNRSPGSVVAGMAALGLDGAADPGLLHFVDAFSPLMGLPVEKGGLLRDAADPLLLAAELERLAQEHPEAALIVDSLSTLLDQATAERFLPAFDRLERAMRRFAFVEALWTRWPYERGVAALVDRFDAIVAVHPVEDRVATGQFFRVERAAWQPSVDTRPRLFRTLHPGGVHVFIPKIVVTGPYNAGKSTFVHGISDSAVSVDQLGTTVALDHGRVTFEGLTADIFGTPGQSRFDPILRLIAGQALGVIVVVDSTKPDSFPRAREMLLQTWRQGLAGVIAANKQDLPGALHPDEVKRILDPPPRVRVIGCSGQDRESGRAVLRALLDQILAPTGGVE